MIEGKICRLTHKTKPLADMKIKAGAGNLSFIYVFHFTPSSWIRPGMEFMIHGFHSWQ